MQAPLTADGESVARIAAKHGFSVEATQAMLDAVVRGGGRMAQFRHAEFSGSGQWMRGGMTMIPDLFDHELKARVDRLCSDLSELVDERPGLQESSRPDAPPSAPASNDAAPDRSAWPTELGQPSSSGSQNGRRYAVFDAAHRLVIEQDGRTTVYDTLDHRIGGVSQQHGVEGSLRFTSQNGIVDVERLPHISASPAPHAEPPESTAGPVDIPALIERLAELQARGILSADEFAAKKAELLARI